MTKTPGQPLPDSLTEHFTIPELIEWSQCPRRAWLNRLGAQPTKRTKKPLATVAANAAKNSIMHAKSTYDPISGTDQWIERSRRRYDFRSSKEIQTETQAKRYARNVRDKFMEFIREQEKTADSIAKFGVEFCKNYHTQADVAVKATIDAVLEIDDQSVGYVLAPWPNHGRAHRHSFLGEFNDATRKINQVYINPVSLAVILVASKPFPDQYLTIEYAVATAIHWIEWSGDEAALETLGREELVPAAPNQRLCQGCRYYGGRFCKEMDYVDLNN